MDSDSAFSEPKPRKGILALLQPAPAWIAIAAFTLFTTACILAGAGKILNLAFPAMALVVGAFLYFRYPILYMGFNWWIWFLSALIRRLSDYRSGFTEPSPILLAPYLVTGVTFVVLWQQIPKAHRYGGWPFILSFVGVLYGFLVGLIYNPPFIVAKALLGWLAPVTLGLYLFANWRDYPSYRQNIQRTFVWGVLVMGIYGIVQFLFAPEWDRFWLLEAPGMLNSQGKPEPLGMRVWSTLNSVEPFGAVMAGGLLVLLTTQGPLRLPASIAGYLAFLLSMARSAWLGWIAGLLTIVISLKAILQIRLVITILLMALCVVPLTTVQPFSDTINTRLQTLSNLQEDQSAQARQGLYKETLTSALTNFQGNGLGNGIGDSAFLSMLTELGWLGTIPYMAGMLLLIFNLFQGSEGRFDPFLASARAIVISCLVRMPVNSAIGGSSGLLLWGFLGIGLAAKKYYQHQLLDNHQLDI